MPLSILAVRTLEGYALMYVPNKRPLFRALFREISPRPIASIRHPIRVFKVYEDSQRAWLFALASRRLVARLRTARLFHSARALPDASFRLYIVARWPLQIASLSACNSTPSDLVIYLPASPELSRLHPLARRYSSAPQRPSSALPPSASR